MDIFNTVSPLSKHKWLQPYAYFCAQLQPFNPFERRCKSTNNFLNTKKIMKKTAQKAAERHAKYVKEAEKIDKQMKKLFAECENEQTKLGIKNDTAKCNKLWKDKYQKRYDSLERMSMRILTAAWYTDSTVPKKSKQINHRSTIAEARSKKITCKK